MSEQSANTAATRTQGENQSAGEISPELVKKVADKVYAMMKADFRKHRERARISGKKVKFRKNR